MSQAPIESAEDKKKKELENTCDSAREILKYCGVTDKAKIDDIIEEMTKYLERKYMKKSTLLTTIYHLILNNNSQINAKDQEE